MVTLEELDEILESGQEQTLTSGQDGKRRLAIYGAFLQSVKPIVNKFDKLSDELASMQSAIDKTRAELAAGIETASAISSRISYFSTSIAAKEAEIEHSSRHLARFRLTPGERERLQAFSQADPHEQPSNLLLGPIQKLIEASKRSSCAVYDEKEEMMGDLVERTNERVAEWFDRNMSSIQLDSVHPSLPTLAAYLIQMRGLQWFTESYTTRRASLLKRTFIEALTLGNNRHTRPIESHAHTPLRYISDILAWLHEAFASELDLLEFILPDGEPPVLERKRMVGGILSECSGEVKERIENVVRDVNAVSDAFSISLVLHYYQEWFARALLISDQSEVLCSTLAGLAERFESLQEGIMDRLYEHCLSESIDRRTLLPSAGLSAILNEICGCDQVLHSTCLGPSSSAALFAKFQEANVQLLLKTLALHGNSSLEAEELEMLRLNCIAVIESGCKEMASLLIPVKQHAMDTVLDMLLTRFFAKAMLPDGIERNAPVASDLAAEWAWKISETLVIHSGWDLEREHLPLGSATFRRAIFEQALLVLASFYEKLYINLSEDETAKLKSPEMIRLMLSIDKP